MTKQQITKTIRAKKTCLCVGLDSDIQQLPHHFKRNTDAVFQFNKAIIDATQAHCVSYKINTAFYESMGAKGWDAMEKTLHYIPKTHFTIADAKRGDIGNTAAQYAKTFFETLPFDAVTVAPYMGEDSVRPFLEYENKYTIVLGLTSNKGSENFQKLQLQNNNQCLYEKVIEKVASWGTENNLMFVIGATQAGEFHIVRKIIPNHFLLVPGIGTQGGDLENVAKQALNKDVGILVNVSRAIIFSSKGVDFAVQATAVAKMYQTKMLPMLQ